MASGETFGRDFSAELAAELDKVGSVEEFCKEWQTKWRFAAITLQGILKIFYPDGAKLLGKIIEVVDRCCAKG